MKKRNWKRYVLISLSVFAALVVVLLVHIYIVTRPRVDSHTRVMARIDINQPIGKPQADSISTWLYGQKGVDHAIVNPASGIAVFSYSPLLNDADRIAAAFRTSTSYVRAQRYMPAPGDMTGGCPVAKTSMIYKVSVFMQHLF